MSEAAATEGASTEAPETGQEQGAASGAPAGAAEVVEAAESGDAGTLAKYGLRVVDGALVAAIKVDGKDEEIQIRDADDLRRHLQKGRHADKATREAAESKKRADAIFDALKNDPAGLLARMGEDQVADVVWRMLSNEDPRIQQAVMKKIDAEARMSPEDRRKRDLDTREERIRAAEEAKEKEAEEAKQAAAVERERARFAKEMPAALGKVGLPADDPVVIERMSGVLLAAMEAGQPLDLDDAAARVRKWLDGYMSRRFEGAKEDELDTLLPADLGKKLRQRDLKKLQGQPGRASAKPAASPTPTPRVDDKETVKDFFAKLRGR